ncbi:hypothetical protein BC739_007104 [Kutzneria viridogrisea]|uniref:Peptidase S1A alpha-lytic prodomain domain-containing protein n=1 Tax=Kutzneria viridogrisea TaxID=47990 RepID=A0ABR6BTA5_9PSEU|nr:S1 family peptidase [Kutzneria albida]MBA8929871.1 hypothetical protein [Kutzneria viridogrisea]
MGSELRRLGSATLLAGVLTAMAAPGAQAAPMAALVTAQATLDAVTGVPNTAWGVDESSHQLVVTISDQAKGPGMGRLLDLVRGMGPLARVRHTARPLSPQLLGGQEIRTDTSICSAGFNVTKGGQLYVLTAGHCTQGGGDWQGLGPTAGSVFPGSDHGLIRNDTGDGPGEVDRYDGGTQRISTVGNARVGEQACKSGRTTGLTCGQVTGLNRTVNYGNGQVVRGLIEARVHCEGGDSGGALFDGGTALGTVSGGDSSTTYFQPVGPALSAYGVTLA